LVAPAFRLSYHSQALISPPLPGFASRKIRVTPLTYSKVVMLINNPAVGSLCNDGAEMLEGPC
jgi:hypothetical protein